MKISKNEIIEIVSFLLVFQVFSQGMIFDYSWKIGWVLIFVLISCQLVIFGYGLFKERFMFDKFLFLLGLLIFIISEPFVFLLFGLGFPSVNDSEFSGNYVGNKVGFILSTYIISFYLGRIFAKTLIRSKLTNFASYKDNINPVLLGSFVALGLLPFFISGDGNFVANFLINISGRASGYVAFSSAGLGNQSPVVALLAQSIPVTILLLVLFAKKRTIIFRVFAVFLSLLMFFLFVSLGGRSGPIIVVVTLFIYWIVRRPSKSFPLFKISLFSTFVLSLLAFQINYRDTGTLEDGFEKSVFVGTELNRELAFIASHYGEQNDFISSNKLITSVLMPMPDTFLLFVTNPIPRILWEDKPVDKSFGAYNYLRLGSTGFETGSNITPTIPGRYYMKYGLLGVIEAGLLIGFLWGWANLYIRNYSTAPTLLFLIPIFSSALLFAATRDLSAGRIYPLLFLLLFFYLNRVAWKSDDKL